MVERKLTLSKAFSALSTSSVTSFSTGIPSIWFTRLTILPRVCLLSCAFSYARRRRIVSRDQSGTINSAGDEGEEEEEGWTRTFGGREGTPKSESSWERKIENAGWME